MSRKLTVGLPCFDDFNGVFFTLQSLRLHHSEVADEVEFLVIDNNPASPEGQAVKKLCADTKTRYVPLPHASGPAASKNHVFLMAETEYVLCMDCHVLLPPGALAKILAFFRSGADAGNLLQGPLLYDDLTSVATHFDPVWRGLMWGIWATDDRGKTPDVEPFEVLAPGMGLFACRRSAWLGFNHKFRGFGGEECYIHEKFRQHGRTTMCLPFLRWVHRFSRPGGVPYPLNLEDRLHNYLMGHFELGLDPKPVCDHFKQELGEEPWAQLWAKVRPAFEDHAAS